MKVLLPDKLEMKCTKCRETFTVRAASLHRVVDITCPFCGVRSNVTDCLPTRIKRQIYHALRDEFEQQVYIKYKEINPDITDPWSENPEDD